MAANEWVEINGHRVPAAQADLFIDGKTGQPIPDAEWDEQMRRLAAEEDSTDAHV